MLEPVSTQSRLPHFQSILLNIWRSQPLKNVQDTRVLSKGKAELQIHHLEEKNCLMNVKIATTRVYRSAHALLLGTSWNFEDILARHYDL